jgi:uncharacterized protein
MKLSSTYFILIVIITHLTACKENAISNRNWVYDNESVLDSSQRERLAHLYAAHELKSTNEIVLITTPTYESDTSILFFSVRKFRQLGIGKKDINNGVLIVLNSAKRQARITTGYGTEKILTDEIAARILDSLMIPRFKNGELFEGLWNGSNAIINFLEKPENKIKK